MPNNILFYFFAYILLSDQTCDTLIIKLIIILSCDSGIVTSSPAMGKNFSFCNSRVSLLEARVSPCK